MSRMFTRSMTKDNSSSFLELPDNCGEGESESEYDTCSESDQDPDYNTEMLLATDTESGNEDTATDLNSSIESFPESLESSTKPIKKKMKFILPKYLEELEPEELQKYNGELRDIETINQSNVPLQFRVMRTKIDIHEKARIIKLIETYEKNREREGDFTKITQYINTIVDIPFGKYNEIILENIESETINNYILSTESTLNSIIYGHSEAKIEILQYICKIIRNPSSSGTSLGIYGPAGIGKTTLVKEGIAKVLGRPFAFISLGGCNDSSYIDGHCFTYEGSKPGMIVDILQKAHCMNPVIYFDELDKISETTKGDEIVNLLIHLTDTSQNTQFTDKYLGNGIHIDLSRAIFVFSFNDIEKINPILRDRIQMIKLNDFSIEEKVKIARDYLLPGIFRDFDSSVKNNCLFTDEMLEYIYTNYCRENGNGNGGVRKYKELLTGIVSKVNMLSLVNCSKQVLELLNIKQNIELPIEFNSRILIDKFLQSKTSDLPNKPPYGMYC